MPDPRTVTLADPEAPVFDLISTLTLTKSVENMKLTLPTRKLELVDVRMLPTRPDPA